MNSPKAHVLKKYPDAYGEWMWWNGIYVFSVYESRTGTIMGSAGSAKAAWHYAYANMVRKG